MKLHRAWREIKPRWTGSPGAKRPRRMRQIASKREFRMLTLRASGQMHPFFGEFCARMLNEGEALELSPTTAGAAAAGQANAEQHICYLKRHRQDPRGAVSRSGYSYNVREAGYLAHFVTQRT